MTAKQTQLYFREWNAVRTILRRQGVPAAECDARRHALHVEALGAQKSSKQFTNADLDRVLAVFRAISQPANLGAQLDAQRQPQVRRLFKLDQLLTQLGAGRPYAEAIARQMNFSTADPESLTRDEFRKLIAALTRQAKRKAKQPAAVATTATDDDEQEGDPF